MVTKMKKHILLVVGLLCVLTLTGCIGFGDSLDQEKIDTQIRESIEKIFPLPDAITIKTHVGEDVTFSTSLTLDEVVAFYREAYAQKGFIESTDSQISADRADLVFHKEGSKDALLQVTKSETGSSVHIRLES